MSATISTTAGIGTTTFSALAPGTYTVSESVDPGFVFDLASCAPGSPPGTSPSATVTMPDVPTATCSFAHSAQGSVEVTKNTTGGNGSFVFTLLHTVPTRRSSDLTAGIGTTTFSALAPGTYTVSESVDPGFVFDLASCAPGSPPGTSPSVTVTVLAGATATCSFANSAKGSVVVPEYTTVRHGSFVFSLRNSVTMSATISTYATLCRSTFSALAPGTYTVSESVDPGFVFDLASCAPGSPPGTSPSVTVTVLAGATATCSFANSAK